MLTASLICTGVHGALQERIYSTYGPYWREGVFYTVRRRPLIIMKTPLIFYLLFSFVKNK